MLGRLVLVGLNRADAKRATAALKEAGAEVVVADGPDDALAECEARPVSALILPLSLSGIDGIHLAEIVRHHHPEATLVFGCSSGLEESYLKTHFLAPVVCVRLPWDQQSLLSAIRSVSDQSVVGDFLASDTQANALASGTFQERPFAAVMIDLLNARSTGVLRIENASVRKAIYFAAGVPIFADSNLLAENLGRFLIQKGVITDSDLARARSVQLAESIKQGEALVRIGALSHAQLFELLRQQIEEKIVNCMALDAADYQFEVCDDFLETKLRFELNPLAILIQGFERFTSADDAATLRNDHEDKLLQVKDANASMWRFASDALPTEFPSWVERRSSIADIGTRMGWPTARLRAVVSAVTAAGMAVICGPETAGEAPRTTPPPPVQTHSGNNTFDSGVYRRVDEIMKVYLSLQSSTYYEVLGVARSADQAAIQAASKRKLEAFSATDFISGVPRYARAKVREMVEKVRVAAEVLLDRDRRQSYDSALAAPEDASQTDQLIEAEVQHVLGIDHLTEHNYETARDYFQRAVDLNQDEPAYKLYLGWATFCAAKPGSEERDESREAVLNALDLNPVDEMGYYFLGRILVEDGEPEKAAEQFEVALHFNPDHEEAQLALDSLEL